MKTTFCIIAAVIGAVMTTATSAWSWDCAPYLERRQAPETVICESPQLKALDDEMGASYYAALDRLPEYAQRKLRQNQMNWLASRNACGFNANCLVGRYRSRIEALDNY